MKIPEKIVPILFLLVLGGAFLIGRYQGKLEILQGGAVKPTTQQEQQAAQQNQQAGTEEQEVILSEEKWNRLMESPAAQKGGQNTPLTILEFTDYQCPACGATFESTLKQIIAEYVDTGKITYMIRDFPLPMHPNANIAAQAARCAGEQGKYWEMHDQLFENQEKWSLGEPAEIFSGFAKQLGMDTVNFSKCLSNEKYAAQVEADLALAQEYKIGGTPMFYFNGKGIFGGLPYEDFKQLIEDELK